MTKKETYRQSIMKGIRSCNIDDTNKFRYYERIIGGPHIYDKPHKRYETKWNLGTLYLEGVLRKKKYIKTLNG